MAKPKPCLQHIRQLNNMEVCWELHIPHKSLRLRAWHMSRLCAPLTCIDCENFRARNLKATSRRTSNAYRQRLRKKARAEQQIKDTESLLAFRDTLEKTTEQASTKGFGI